MNSRNLVNLFLFILLAAFVGFYFFKQSTPVEQARLTQLDINQIAHIRIPRSKQDIVLSKQPTGWYMTSPYKIHAHEFRVKTLLSLTQSGVDKSYPTDTLNLEDYGLQPPRARIVFNETEIAFGKNNPVNGLRYLMVDNQLSLHADKTFPLVSAQPTAFIDLRLLPPQDQLKSIQFDHYTIEKTPEGSWHSTATHSITTDQIHQLIENWQHTQAFAVHNYMPRKQSRKVTLVLGNKIIEYEISDDGTWLIFGRRDLGIEYHLDASLKEKLFGADDA